jgi:sodium/hydrogen antiporter
MYQTIAILAGFLLIYSAVSGLVERSSLSGPIAFTVVGLILGPRVFDILYLDLKAHGLRTLAEFTLAMVLFTDAANADIRFVRHQLGIPQRLLLIGLPMTILLGMAFAWALFPSLALLEVALLAAILAPTDAALGAPVVTNPAVPAVMQESLNLESRLNDGICVPVILILLGYATGTQVEHAALTHVTMVVVEEIGIVVGLTLTAAASAMMRLARRHAWTSGRWLETPALGLAAACFAAAQAIGGSGLIACFVGDLLLSRYAPA